MLETKCHRIHQSNRLILEFTEPFKSMQHLARKEALCKIHVSDRSSPGPTRNSSRVTFTNRCCNQILCSCLLSLEQAICAYTRSDSKVIRLIFFWLYWQYWSPPTQTAVYLDPSSIPTCSGMALQ